jgi:hypothetical protein
MTLGQGLMIAQIDAITGRYCPATNGSEVIPLRRGETLLGLDQNGDIP